jgi:hypothetical protein
MPTITLKNQKHITFTEEYVCDGLVAFVDLDSQKTELTTTDRIEFKKLLSAERDLVRTNFIS